MAYGPATGADVRVRRGLRFVGVGRNECEQQLPDPTRALFEIDWLHVQSGWAAEDDRHDHDVRAVERRSRDRGARPVNARGFS